MKTLISRALRHVMHPKVLVFGVGIVLLASCAGPSTVNKASEEWPVFNGSYAANRFSTLKQINKENVESLAVVGRYELPEVNNFQTGPIVVGDTLFFTTVTNTYAIDARTGVLRWASPYAATRLGIGTPVRGLAFAKGRVYRGTTDAHLIALDAQTGKTVWDVSVFDVNKGEYFTAAPIIWKDRLYIGNSGSDIGAIGHVMAFDINDGRRIWSFDNVPASGPGASSWPSDPPKLRAGGGMYSSFALDTETGILYTPTGNPGPDFNGEYRPGDNLYTCSVVMLDAETGALRGYHQFVPHDVHDWDIAASPILFTSKAGRKMVGVGGKNGYLYGLDRDLKSVIYQVPVCTISNIDAPITAEGTHFMPGTQGGVNWNGPAYSPLENTLYVQARDAGCLLKLGGQETLQNHKVGDVFIGSANVFGEDDVEQIGWITAVDADTGKARWKYRSDKPLVAALTPTAGGLLLTADLEGNFIALDAATGDVILKKQLTDPIGGGVITYSIGGKQYVALAVGMKNYLMKTQSGPASIVILALPQ
jgi:alcohol dehydrogenase (cytochrome c)